MSEFNVKYHGAFNNPEDLPGIYAQIDMARSYL